MHVVVDGSNLATEGRTLPSLQQLIEGVLDFRGEHPEAEVVVVVDATFGHRIDDAERALFEDAIVHQEIVSPPAGAIGRGDAFVLRIAEKVGATVLSNDSFQEFHAEHDWLFDQGRLIGGKPVPGVGWIFTPRTPVRGPRSREVTQEAKRKQRKSTGVSSDAPLLSGAELLEKGKAALDKLPKARREKPKKEETKGRGTKRQDHKHDARPEGGDEAVAAGPRRNRRSRGPVEDAIAVATVEAVVPDADDETGGGGKRRKRRRKAAPAEPVNEPGVFLELVAAFRPGDLVEGEVEQFSSHGAFVIARGARCYIPLTLMGDPAPRAARDVLKRGDVRSFVLRAFDAARRGVELALPGIDLPVGPVAEETAAAAVGAEAPEDSDDVAVVDEGPKRSRRAKKVVAEPTSGPEPVTAAGAELAPARPRRAKKAAPVEAVEEAPTRPRRKKAAAEPAPLALEEEAAAGAAAAPGGTQADEAATEEVAPVARPRRAKKAPAPSVAEPAGAAVAEPAAAAPRRTRKSAAASATGQATPAPRTRKKAAASAVAPTAVSDAAPPEAALLPAAEAAPAAKPRSRARKAAPAAWATPGTQAAPAESAPAAESAPPEAALLPAAEAAPAAKPRNRAKKAAPAAPPGPAAPAPAAPGAARADEEAPVEAPAQAPAEVAPARPRGSPKAKAGIEQPAAMLAAEDAPAVPTPRRRTAKKAAPPVAATPAKRAPKKKAPPT